MLTALRLHRDLIINRHRDTALFLPRHLAQSVLRHEVSEELLESLEKDEKLLPEVARSFKGDERTEPYHRMMLLVAERLRRTLDDERAGSSAAGSDAAAYTDTGELQEDLLLVRRSLLRHGGERAANRKLRDFVRQVEVFGFHLARLDIRQESSRVSETVAELLKASGEEEDYSRLDGAGKAKTLRRLLREEPVHKKTTGTKTCWRRAGRSSRPSRISGGRRRSFLGPR
jgi:phosphoenolpyruvate carboxylase